MNNQRHYSKLDELCLRLDQAIRTLFSEPAHTHRPYPAEDTSDAGSYDTKHSAGIMRINHAGEVCAQALYQGQALFSRNPEIKDKMHQAAIEEGDHLKWCSQRIMELNSHVSYLNPLWYIGSFSIGAIAGVFGDPWSLGFVAETETQVIKHLETQMKLLPTEDLRSYKILQQMQEDEAKHKQDAIHYGARELPRPIKAIMNVTAKIMVKTAYFI